MKRIKRTPAEKARAQYTGYLVKEPMELMDFLAAKMPDASRTKLKSLLSKRIVLVDNVITTQFNFPLQPGMKVLISKDKNKKEFPSATEDSLRGRLYHRSGEKGRIAFRWHRAAERTYCPAYFKRICRSFGTRKPHLRGSSPGPGYFGINDVCQRRKDTIHVA